MAGETVITVVGNLVDDPELRFTPAGAAVAKFRIASTPRRFNKTTNEWEDGDALFLTCSVWRQAAENVAESLARGVRVIVQGRLKQRSYEDGQGVKRTVYELDVDEVGVSLVRATAVVTKKTSGGQANVGQRPTDDGWANARPADGQQQAGGWSTTPSAQQQPAAQGAGYSDEPPF
jgi:single-strand DNA-binding protein